MQKRAPLPRHACIIEHELIQYLRVEVVAKTRAEAEASVEDACRAMLTRPAYLALAYQAQWEVHTNQMRLVDGIPGDRGDTNGSPTHAGNTPHRSTEARLIAALAQLAVAHSDTNAITDHARHDTDTPVESTTADTPVDACTICAAFDVLMEEGQAALEEHRQAYDDLQQHCEALQAQCATLQAAQTRLQEEYAMLQERHEAMTTAYFAVTLDRLDDRASDQADVP